MRRSRCFAVGHERKRHRVGRALGGARDDVVGALQPLEPLLDRHGFDGLDVGQGPYRELFHATLLQVARSISSRGSL